MVKNMTICYAVFI